MEQELFLDTFFVHALLSRRDRYHHAAQQLAPTLKTARRVVTTTPILIEIGDSLARNLRQGAMEFIRACQRSPNFKVISLTEQLFEQALELYQARPDKTWGLTDCFSFIVMAEEGLTAALTADEHFRQAGFKALLLEPDQPPTP